MPDVPLFARFSRTLATARWSGIVPLQPLRWAHRRRAPWAVIGGLSTFAALQLGLGFAGEFMPRLRDPFYGDKAVKLNRRIRAFSDSRPVVVTLGTSRTGLGFHGKVVENRLLELGQPAIAFNFGIPASGPVTHRVYLNRLLDSGIVPDVLVLEILPSMLTGTPGQAPLEKNWLLADRLLYRERGEVVRLGFDEMKVEERYWQSMILPWYTLRFALLSRVSPSWVPVKLQTRWSQDADDCGWGKMLNQDPTAEERAMGLARTRGEYAPVLSELRPGGPATMALNEIIAVCRDRKIALRLLIMPEATAFRGWYPPETQQALAAYFQQLQAGQRVELIDARNWLNDDSFFDGHHMREVGAEEFSKRLAADVIAPALNERRR